LTPFLAALGALVGFAISFGVVLAANRIRRGKDLGRPGGGGLLADLGLGRLPPWQQDSGGRAWQVINVAVATPVAAIFFGIAGGRFPAGLELLSVLILGTAFIALLAIDIETGLLPDVIVGPAALLALVSSYWTIGIGEALVTTAILLALFGPFYLIANWLRPGGWGMGDLKLTLLIGLVGGWPAAFQGLFAGALIGGAVTLPLLLVRLTPLGRHAPRIVPYGPFLAIGGLVALLGRAA
jgi:leader peptidase (prepilin peptidase)/N-methyltransferase